MELICLPVGQLATNCYILYFPRDKGKGKEGFVIDPGGDCDKILQVIDQYNISVRAIINTHGHADHIFCNETLKMALGCEVWMSEAAALVAGDKAKNMSEFAGMDVVYAGVDRELEEGEKIRLGRDIFRVWFLPGHSPGGIGLVCKRAGRAFLGDLMFDVGWGRTDGYGGDIEVLRKSAKRVLSELGRDLIVYSGHGGSFTVGHWAKNHRGSLFGDNQ